MTIPETFTSVGKNVLRVDAVGKVTGATSYPGDIDIPGQAWLKVRFSDRVHARVVSIDTSAAEATPRLSLHPLLRGSRLSQR